MVAGFFYAVATCTLWCTNGSQNLHMIPQQGVRGGARPGRVSTIQNIFEGGGRGPRPGGGKCTFLINRFLCACVSPWPCGLMMSPHWLHRPATKGRAADSDPTGRLGQTAVGRTGVAAATWVYKGYKAALGSAWTRKLRVKLSVCAWSQLVSLRLATGTNRQPTRYHHISQNVIVHDVQSV